MFRPRLVVARTTTGKVIRPVFLTTELTVLPIWLFVVDLWLIVQYD